MNPIVIHRGTSRKAKGFSVKEIKDAGIDCCQVCALRIPFDLRRKTAYKENVAALKALGKELPKTAPAKTKAK